MSSGFFNMTFVHSSSFSALLHLQVFRLNYLENVHRFKFSPSLPLFIFPTYLAVLSACTSPFKPYLSDYPDQIMSSLFFSRNLNLSYIIPLHSICSECKHIYLYFNRISVLPVSFTWVGILFTTLFPGICTALGRE